MRTPRPEHPTPQFRRDSWLNLNGPWTFQFDPGRSGVERGLARSRGFKSRILVPFCPESRLSGVGHTDFIPAIWYHRRIAIPPAWRGRRIFIHFGGVDYESELYVDGRPAGAHHGGAAAFTHEITQFVTPGREHHLVLRVHDDNTTPFHPRGKQSPAYASHDCFYTRTTGIWQTVWMEAAPPHGLRRAHIVPDLDGGRFVFTPEFFDARAGHRFRARVAHGGREAASAEEAAADGAAVSVKIPAPRAWSPADPHLYGVTFEVLDRAGAVVDSVRSYAGLRKVHCGGGRVLLNNEPVFLRFVLDQGFYPAGVWTAPSERALRRDIELAMRAGFSGARLHQKVFEPRFHYWADRLGYLTWAESPSWGCDPNLPEAARCFLAEWREIVLQQRNHPSIIAWTPWNETGRVTDRAQHARTLRDSYDICRQLDPTRPVNDSSGYTHVKTDLWTVHNYTQDPRELLAQLTPSGSGGVFRNKPALEPAWAGQPYIVAEFGGIKWVPRGARAWSASSWGYGEAPRTLKEFHARLAGQVKAVLSLPHVCGYCYTQLTDVEQEQNGIYAYDRGEKFDAALLRAAFGAEPKRRRTRGR